MSRHIFVSYSHEDKPWLDRLVKILEQARIQFGLEFWTDARISVSGDWNEGIRQALEDSSAAILLVSGSFLSSRFIKEVEVTRLVHQSKEHPLPVFPLLISECLWRKVDWLASIQVFPNSPVLPLDQVPDHQKQEDLLLQFVGYVVDSVKGEGSPAQPASAFPSHPSETQTAPASAIAGNEELSSENVIVLAVDIRNFTLMAPNTQRKAIKALWETIEEDPASSLASDVMPNEDGVILLFPPHGGAQRRVLEMTQAWIKSLALIGQGVHLRAALHQGLVSRIRIHTLKTPLPFGTTINECRKVCSFSGDGHIVISEAFLDGWNGTEDANYERLSPGRGKAPIDVMVKEDRHIGIRLAGEKGDKPPERVAFLNVVDEEIMDRLWFIEESLVATLKGAGLARARQVASPRVSILSPVKRHGKLFLASSSFRYHHNKKEKKRGDTFYDLDSPGAGTCGRAYVSGDIQIAAGFPDFREEESAYVQMWKHKWNMEEEVVRGYSRKSRAVMSLPLGISKWPAFALGVVCIDCLHPLTGVGLRKVTRASLREYCKEINEEFIPELALLWMHRMNHMNH